MSRNLNVNTNKSVELPQFWFFRELTHRDAHGTPSVSWQTRWTGGR